MEKQMHRPAPGENHPYYNKYIDQVPGEDFLQVMKEQRQQTPSFLQSFEHSAWDYRYAPDKWSVRELILHILDTERIMSYRALRISRNDKTPLAGFEQDDYVPFSGAAFRSPSSLIEEYIAVRDASITLFKNLNEKMLEYTGTASGYPFTPRALGFIIPGHEIHHMRILKERYILS